MSSQGRENKEKDNNKENYGEEHECKNGKDVEYRTLMQQQEGSIVYPF